MWSKTCWTMISHRFTGCFFLRDHFETLITPSILKISSFCKVVMTNQTGPFDNQQQSSWKKYYDMHKTAWIQSIIFRKFVDWRRIFTLFIIQMSITPKVFGLEKRNCTFWKWQSFSFKMMCVTYISDKNYGFYRPKHTVRKEKFIHLCL